MDILIANQYIDFNDIKTPIKYQYDAKYYVSISDLLNTYLVLTVAKNEYTLYDSIFWGDTVTSSGEFYRVDFSSHAVIERHHPSSFLLRIDVRISGQINQYERRVYPLYSLIGNIGGFYGIIDIA
jgi:hypothetical protein